MISGLIEYANVNPVPRGMGEPSFIKPEIGTIYCSSGSKAIQFRTSLTRSLPVSSKRNSEI